LEGLERFDLVGMVLAGAGVAGLAFGLSVAGLGLVPPALVVSLIATGAIFMAAYVLHARHTPIPVLDFSLVRIATFRANVVSGSLFRMGIGALAFLLPLMLQLGFDYTPLQSGLVTFTAAVGAFTMKSVAARIIRRFGFRRILIVGALLSSAFTAACGLFTPNTPFWIMIAVLLVGGFFRSLQFTATNTIAYADVDARRMSRATPLVSVAQQLSIAAGVAIGALAVELAVQLKGGSISAEHFRPAFMLIGLISASSAWFFWSLPPDAGAAMTNRAPIAAPDASDQRIG
jgi:MFS family permease